MEGKFTKGTVTEKEKLWEEAKRLYGGGVGTADLIGDNSTVEADEPTDDEMFAVFEAAQKGELTAPGGEALDLSDDEPSDDEVWQSYVELQDGTASRQRALQNARWEEQEREAEWLEYYRASGSPLNVDHEHLRPQLREHGY